MVELELKKCCRCRMRKPLSMFHRDRSSKKDGRGRICKACKREYCRRRYGRNTRKVYLWTNELKRWLIIAKHVSQ